MQTYRDFPSVLTVGTVGFRNFLDEIHTCSIIATHSLYMHVRARALYNHAR